MSGGSALFGLKALRQKWELIPLVGILGTACIGATAYSIYAVATKSDVRVNKTKAVAPWEEVNPNVPQKLLTLNQKYAENAELEALRKEIGSYKC
ncbi:DgyrCDS11666 [Dimorphilus gyrociliatus]|uniref:DgyrCDS11666 n=1 Tax=Dimorphilus gyrociliatus TaxID=2664684 RepID=A0A7I8W5X2_9ANNE|nr:DgyrCDS11666 [Dimorphilus gyrociliatus]